LVADGLAHVLFLERAGKVVGAQNTGIWKGGAIYWSGASLDERSGGDNRLLFDAQFMTCRRQGCRYYEAGQAYPAATDPKEKGLSDFKSSFGSRLAAFPAGKRLAPGRGRRLLAGLRLARAAMRSEAA
jgi:hypothetical protein